MTPTRMTVLIHLADQTVSATTTDDDAAGFTVLETAGSTSVSESGTTDTFTVVLTAEPASNVVITGRQCRYGRSHRGPSDADVRTGDLEHASSGDGDRC